MPTENDRLDFARFIDRLSLVRDEQEKATMSLITKKQGNNSPIIELIPKKQVLDIPNLFLQNQEQDNSDQNDFLLKVRNLSPGKTLRIKKDELKGIPRTLNIIRDAETGEFRLMVETKSKYWDPITQKTSKHPKETQSGVDKTGKKVFRADAITKEE